MNITPSLRNGIIGISLTILAHLSVARANSAIAVNERSGAYCWVASGAPLIDLEVTAKHWLMRNCGVRPDSFPASTGRGWCAVAVNRKLKKIGYAMGWESQNTAKRKALERAGGERAGATLEFVVNEQGNRNLSAIKCRLWR